MVDKCLFFSSRRKAQGAGRKGYFSVRLLLGCSSYVFINIYGKALDIENSFGASMFKNESDNFSPCALCPAPLAFYILPINLTNTSLKSAFGLSGKVSLIMEDGLPEVTIRP
jgi:hypothetical protein